MSEAGREGAVAPRGILSMEPVLRLHLHCFSYLLEDPYALESLNLPHQTLAGQKWQKLFTFLPL